MGFDHKLGVALWRRRAAVEHVAKAGTYSGRSRQTGQLMEVKEGHERTTFCQRCLFVN